MAAEKQFENKVKDFLKAEGIYYDKTHGDRFSKKGRPDLFICGNGFFIGAEAKVDSYPTKLQLYHIRNIVKSGGLGFILCPADKVEKQRTYILNNYPDYADTEIYNFEQFKRLIFDLKSYSNIVEKHLK